MNHKAFAEKMSDFTILYIEDDREIRNHISEFLSRYCKELYSCESAESGLEIYKKYKPDILLIDINLPGMNGIDFAELIRQNDEKLRIIVITAYTDPKFMIKAVELELSKYLVKPVTSEDLYNALDKCIDYFQKENLTFLGDKRFYNKKLASIIVEGESISLRKKEVEILEYFIENEGKIISYEELESVVWHNDNLMSRDAIRSQIRNVRQKIGNNFLKNIINVGYIFKAVDDT